jgi:hypothetical protein
MANATPNDKRALPPPGAVPPVPSCQILQYTRGVWGEAADPITEEGDFLEAAAEAGFWFLNQHGVEHSALWLQVFEHQEDGAYLVVVNAADRCHSVLAPDLPSLLGLLGELLPVVEASMRLEAAAEEHERKMKVRRRGGTYNAARRCMEVPS